MPQQSGGGRLGKDGKAGFDGDQMGMTQERQREIQASLFKMLGQADDPVMEESKNENAAPSTSTKSRAAIPPTQHQQQQQQALPAQNQAKRSSSSRQVGVVTAIPATPSDEAG
jgi:hypothetical protein